jgi:predicted CoA-binding protein
MAPLDEAVELLRHTSTRIAVVGASNDPRKFGNIITKDMLRHGYQVFPVNPSESAVAGLTAYPTLADVPKPVDIVDVVTQPEITLQILKDAEAAGCRLVWLQPGSFDDAVLEAAARTTLSVVDDACILVEARRVAKSKG